MKYIISLLTVFFLFSCQSQEKYQVTTTKDGNLYRLNKQSGEITRLEGDNLVPVVETKPTTQSEKSDIKKWPQLNLPFDNIKMGMKSTWKNGRMYFVLTIAPYTRTLHQAMSKNDSKLGFILDLKDKDGFQMLKVPVPFVVMQRLFNQKGEVIGLMANTNIPVKKELYQDVETWSASWNLGTDNSTPKN